MVADQLAAVRKGSPMAALEARATSLIDTVAQQTDEALRRFQQPLKLRPLSWSELFEGRQ